MLKERPAKNSNSKHKKIKPSLCTCECYTFFCYFVYQSVYGCDTFNLNTERTQIQNNIEEKNHQKNRDMMSTYGFILYIIMII